MFNDAQIDENARRLSWDLYLYDNAFIEEEMEKAKNWKDKYTDEELEDLGVSRGKR